MTNIKTQLAKRRLATLWFVSACLLIILLLIMSFGDKFYMNVDGKPTSQAQQAWSWLSTAILPTLSLIISVFISDMRSNASDQSEVDRFYFRLAFFPSLFYLILLFVTITLPTAFSKSTLEAMAESNIWLGMLQGVVSSCIGLFFFKK